MAERMAEVSAAAAAAAVALTETLLGRAQDDAAPFARAALGRALAAAGTEVVQRVRMNPDDLALVADAVAAADGIEFVADPALGRGDAMAELQHGLIDARLTSALDRARAALLGGAE
jgi:flagellar assembly protein FliH